MYYKETGFRGWYRRFVAFPMKDEYKLPMINYPQIEKANCLLAYGYIDREAGLTLEVLATGFEQEERCTFFDPPERARFSLSGERMENEEFLLMDDRDKRLSSRYGKKLAGLQKYAAGGEIEKTREMRFLDDSRHPFFPDDVQVYLMRQGLKPEPCWTRISGLAENWIKGVLLNEPEQDFGCHQGEEVAINLDHTEDGKVICYANMNPGRLLKPEDLEDGSMLRQAIRTFQAEGTKEAFFEILETLRDSYVWVPCNAVLGEEDQKAFAEMMDKAGDDPAALVGMEMKNQEKIRLVPDILQNGDNFFFPAFITQEDMGQYGQYFSKVKKHFLEVIALARNNEKQLSGIVINAFTEPWILDRELFDLVANLKSRLVQEQ